jgi:ribosomal protein S18 acetylase RimI-like enzyme
VPAVLTCEAVPAPVIREAHPEELDEVRALLVTAYLEHLPPASAPLPPAARESWESYRANIADVRSRLPHAKLLVATVGDRPLGTVTFYPRAGAAAQYPELPAAWAAFRLLGVHPDARGQGLGRLLTVECIQRARAAEAPVLGLHTTSVMAQARAMYVRMGFRASTEHDFSPAPGLVVEGYRLDL